MPKLLKIGIVGCGAIGSSLAKIIISDFSGKAELASIYDIELENAYRLAKKLDNQKLVALNLDNLINKVNLVIEATKAGSSFEIAKKSIVNSRDVMVMSVGGLIERYKELAILAEDKHVRLFIPTGAICGIDGLKAAVLSGKINKVVLTTRKPAKAFLGVPYILKKKIRLDNIKEEVVVFEGSALSAAKFFPQNINVASTLSIAGIGPENTLVRIIASPHIERNIHEIEIDSGAGKIITRCENIAHPDNPKTSYLAVLSAQATLKQILDSIKIGT